MDVPRQRQLVAGGLPLHSTHLTETHPPDDFEEYFAVSPAMAGCAVASTAGSSAHSTSIGRVIEHFMSFPPEQAPAELPADDDDPLHRLRSEV